MLSNKTFGRCILCIFFEDRDKKGEKDRVHHDNHFSLQSDIPSFSAVESIRQDCVLIMKVHFNLSAKDIKQPQCHNLSYNLSLPCREADSNDFSNCLLCKKMGEKHTHTIYN